MDLRGAETHLRFANAVSVLVDDLAEPLDVLVHLGLEGSGDQPASAGPDDRRQHVLGRRHWFVLDEGTTLCHVAYPSPVSGALGVVVLDTKGTPLLAQDLIHNIWSYLRDC